MKLSHKKHKIEKFTSRFFRTFFLPFHFMSFILVGCDIFICVSIAHYHLNFNYIELQFRYICCQFFGRKMSKIFSFRWMSLNLTMSSDAEIESQAQTERDESKTKLKWRENNKQWQSISFEWLNSYHEFPYVFIPNLFALIEWLVIWFWYQLVRIPWFVDCIVFSTLKIRSKPLVKMTRVPNAKQKRNNLSE